MPIFFLKTIQQVKSQQQRRWQNLTPSIAYQTRAKKHGTCVHVNTSTWDIFMEFSLQKLLINFEK